MEDARDALSDLRTAYASQDWNRVLALAAALRGPDLAPPIRSAVDLTVGTALFSLGRNAEALGAFETGLSQETAAGVDRNEPAYFAGMAAMMSGDLERSRRHLQAAVEGSVGSPWPHDAAVRGLAQVEGELGHFDEGLALLRQAGPDISSQVISLIIAARLHARAGRVAEAIVGLQLATAGLSIDLSDDIPRSEIQTIATMLSTGADVYNTLGQPSEALPILDRSDALLARVGDPPIPARHYARLFRAASLRLLGRVDEAEAILDAAEGMEGAADDAAPIALRERARIAFDQGDADRATRLWEEAARGFEAVGYVWQAGEARREIAGGPPRERPVAAVPEPDLPDAVIVRFRGSGDDAATHERLLEVAHAVEDLVPAAYDGWEVGPDAFVVYLYGDPHAIWRVIAETVRASAPPSGGTVTLRMNGEETTTELRVMA